jgi:hypothetical protein
MNLDFISNQHTRSMISNGYTAVSQMELWDWMKSFEPDENKGFMWSDHPNITRIIHKMESLPDAPGHSGSSFAITMRHLQFIAKNGVEQYRRQFYQ